MRMCLLRQGTEFTWTEFLSDMPPADWTEWLSGTDGLRQLIETATAELNCNSLLRRCLCLQRLKTLLSALALLRQLAAADWNELGMAGLLT